MSKQLLPNLSKVSHAFCWWENQTGCTRRTPPTKWMVYGERFDPTEFAYPHVDYPFETCGERALRLGIIDVWTFKVTLVINNRELYYSGAVAEKIWQSYKAVVFGNKQRRSKL